MKKAVVFLVLIAACVFSVQAQELRVGTYNIRYKNSDDSIKGNVWSKRCQVICDQVNVESPDVWGAQEVLHSQLIDMLDRLDNYGYIGVGRDDGDKKGEYAVIFYKKDRMQLLDSGHFWLNETPDKPALGWDAACVRICTWGKFVQKREGTQESQPSPIFFFNLHMDHVGVVARREAARLVISKIKELATGAPVILTGDFNVDQTDEIYGIFTNSGILVDTYDTARLRFAENGTFQAYKTEFKTQGRIDHIFVSTDWAVESYALRTDSYWTDRRRNASDHYPVFVRLKQ